MFILGFITVAAIAMFIGIAIFTWGVDESKTVKEELESMSTWLILGFSFIVNCLGSIGLYCWSKYCRR